MAIQTNSAPILDSGKLRKEIRKRIAAILKNKTDAGPRVFPNATIPPDVSELPVILIYPRSESASKYATAPRELARDLDVTIEIYAKGPETDEEGTPPSDKKSLEDILDDVAEQVECEMSKDETLQCTADDSILTNTEIEFESGGVPVGTARLTYSVIYYTMSPRRIEKQTSLPPFKKAQVDYHIGDVDEKTREANDTIDIPQS